MRHDGRVARPPSIRNFPYTVDGNNRYIPTTEERFRYLRHELQRLFTLRTSIDGQIKDCAAEVGEIARELNDKPEGTE